MYEYLTIANLGEYGRLRIRGLLREGGELAKLGFSRFPRKTN